MASRRLIPLAIALLMAPLAACSDAGEPDLDVTREPRPPQLLHLVPVGPLAGDGVGTVEAIVSPGLDADVSLEVLEPEQAEFEGRSRRLGRTLVRGGAELRERIRVPLRSDRPGRLRVRLSAIGADGEPWLVLEQSLVLNAPARPAAERRRVPVVRELPDRTRIVEYVDAPPGEAGAARETPPPPGPPDGRDAGDDPPPQRRPE